VREKEALVRARPELVERELLQAAGWCGEFSEQERIALADKLADAANRHLWRAHELSRVAQKVRAGGI